MTLLCCIKANLYPFALQFVTDEDLCSRVALQSALIVHLLHCSAVIRSRINYRWYIHAVITPPCGILFSLSLPLDYIIIATHPVSVVH